MVPCRQEDGTNNQEDRVLVRALIEGSPGAAEGFIDRFARFVYAIFARQLRLDPATADDLFQTLFLRLMEDDWRRLRNWRGDGDLADYLAPIARNLALDHLRRTGRDPAPAGEGDEDDFERLTGEEPTPEELAAMQEERRALEGWVERLPERDRQLYRLRFVEERKHREIAEELGLSVSHVGVALLRLERKLVARARETSLGRVKVRSEAPRTSPD